MYKNINFPEGTKTESIQYLWLDYYDKDYEYKGYVELDISRSYSNGAVRGVYRDFDFSKVTEIDSYGLTVLDNTYYPTIDLTSCQKWQSNLSSSNSNQPKIVFEGSLQNLQVVINSGANLEGIVFYYPTGQPTNVLRSSFTTSKFIPYGDVPVKLRVLKDGAWMDGTESILYDGVEMNYKGGGLYEITKTVLPRKRFNFPITVGEYLFKSPDVSDSESIIYLGDNSGNFHTIEGADILNYATDNSNGWFYDATNNGITNNDIGNNGSTTLTLSIPSLSIDIVYGQSSEKNYDFMSVLDADGNIIFTAKGVDGTDKTATINNTSNTYVFKYSKDTSSDYGSDSCWINSITYNQLPDYPEN